MPTENTNLSISTEPDGAAAPRPVEDAPQAELTRLAQEYGLDAGDYPNHQELAIAIQDRQTMIASLDKAAMLELVAWGRKTAAPDATKDALARQIAAIRSMRFAGLSQAALFALARLRQVQVADADDVPTLIRKLKRQESLLEKFKRKKRSFLGKLVSNLVGESDHPHEPTADPSVPPAAPRENIRQAIEESGFFGGITNRIKKSADQYLNQKLDEIEARIDRKLDEIDHRLGEWRDREIANRIKILKITLWASVIVGIVSLIYAWIKVYFIAA